MDALLDRITWPLCAIIIAIIFFILFKDKLTYISFDPRNRRFKAMFKQNVNKAKSRAKNIKETVASSGMLTGPEKAIDFGKQTARDIVIEEYGALKQTVYNACMSCGIPLTPSTGIPAATERLLALNVIDADVAYLIDLLHTLGQELVNSTALMPLEDDARSYQELSDILIDGIMLNLLPAPEHVATGSETAVTEHERTVVAGGYRQPPATGQPTAFLIGTGGSVRGMQVPIERTPFTIGANTESDLCIARDGFVSGRHAEIRFEKGSLFLFDRQSSNGTYLNDEKIVKGAALIQLGDKLRVGESVFLVSQSPMNA